MPQNQYLKVSEFFDSKTVLQNGIQQARMETNELRHDMDNKLTLLTTQIQQILGSFNQQISKNDTIVELQDKYGDLLDNFTKLQNKYIHLQDKYVAQESELLFLRNKTTSLERRVTDLDHLKSVQTIKNEFELQQQVQVLKSETHVLTVNEQARRQDFQALYNLTLNLGKKADKLDEKIQKSDLRSNISLLDIRKEIDDLVINQTNLTNTKVQKIVHDTNKSLALINQQIVKTNEKVGLTACMDTNGNRASGSILKFHDVSTSYNIHNLQAFQNTGKFKCEEEGLYLVSAWIFARPAPYLAILKNNNLIGRAYSYDSTSHNSATFVGVVNLNVNDFVWVQTDTSTNVYNHPRTSCLTIIKIK
ncbi:Hypothetical predicted protein [Mytilus galloprovincialis]|nr:Hypothetical predicted protein [Mytilus galloprovincialis]